MKLFKIIDNQCFKYHWTLLSHLFFQPKKILIMRKLIWIAAVALFSMTVHESFGQSKIVGGEWAIGPRFGGMSGVSLKHYSGSNTSAFEFIGGWNFDKEVEGSTLTVLWEKLAHLSGNGQISAVFGLGPTFHFGDPFRMGATGILGFDWRLKAVPVSMQVDWAPTWFFVNGSHFSAINAGYTVRYILNNRKKH